MSLFDKLFGGGKSATPEAEAISYNGFSIYPDPIKDGGKWRVAARIEKEVDGEMRTHHLIRAETLDDHQSAVEVSVGKARQMIDEQGVQLFG